MTPATVFATCPTCHNTTDHVIESGEAAYHVVRCKRCQSRHEIEMLAGGRAFRWTHSRPEVK